MDAYRCSICCKDIGALVHGDKEFKIERKKEVAKELNKYTK